MPSIKFTYTGSIHTFTIPNDITSVILKVWGAAGGPNVALNSLGGAGGYSTGQLNVLPGTILNIMTGGAGISQSTASPYGGGGPGGGPNTYLGSSGGGRSGVAFSGSPTQFIIAGGGGGAGPGSISLNIGGNGGGLTGNDEFISPSAGAYSNLVSAKGGTQTAGGAGGYIISTPSTKGGNGSSLLGGTGGTQASSGNGGGGGGGYFGGGGGSGANGIDPAPEEQAGGGGSGYLDNTILYNALTLSTTQPTIAGAILPPHSTDKDYVTGVGVSNMAQPAGNGLVVAVLPDLILTKSVDKIYAGLNDSLLYTITVQNTGPGYVNNVNFTDTVPTASTFISNSLTFNGVSITNSTTPNFVFPYSIPENGIYTVTFSVLLNTLSTSVYKNQAMASYNNNTYKYISNQVTTTLASATLSSTKTVSPTVANLNTILTYTTTFTNVGNVTANNLVFIDTIPSFTSFLSNSLNVNGTVINNVTPNPPGVTISIPTTSLPANRTLTVSFKVQVVSVPSTNSIPNSACLNYTFTQATIVNGVSGSSNTNFAIASANILDISGFKKSVDKFFAKCSDTLTYTIIIPNTGNVPISNLIFKDTIPNSTNFTSGSVIINNVSYPSLNPALGFTLPDLLPQNSITLSFSVTVTC